MACTNCWPLGLLIAVGFIFHLPGRRGDPDREGQSHRDATGTR